MTHIEPNSDPLPANELVAFQLLPSGNIQVEFAGGESGTVALPGQVPTGLTGMTSDELLALLVDRSGPLPVGVRFYRHVVETAGNRRVVFTAQN